MAANYDGSKNHRQRSYQPVMQECRLILATHIKDKTGLAIHPSKVRLITRKSDGYFWRFEEQVKFLFDRNLSEHGAPAVQKLMSEVGRSFEARAFEPETQPLPPMKLAPSSSSSVILGRSVEARAFEPESQLLPPMEIASSSDSSVIPSTSRESNTHPELRLVYKRLAEEQTKSRFLQTQLDIANTQYCTAAQQLEDTLRQLHEAIGKCELLECRILEVFQVNNSV